MQEKVDELFPYPSFPVRLHQKEENKIAWFKDDYDLQKYLERYKLDKRTIKINYRDGEPVKPGKKHKKDIQQGTGKTSDGSASRSKRSTKNVDAIGDTHRTRKLKK